jgi:hypothetical protein
VGKEEKKVIVFLSVDWDEAKIVNGKNNKSTMNNLNFFIF